MHLGTQTVLLTPIGRSAVATLLVDGPRATEIVSRLFQPAGNRPFAEQPIDRILFGRWPSSEAGEDVVVCRRATDRVEINCHGGRMAARAIVDTLGACDCREVDWPTWLQQTTADPLEADARTALADAVTERTALILWEQHCGALRRAVDEVASLVAANELPAALAKIDDLLAWSPLGLHLTVPWRVVLAGRPNVGKSSLINALVGYRRAIVHSTPGTTRDVVTASAAVDGWPIELADTAGMRSEGQQLEKAGIQLAREQAASADLLLLLFDRSQPWSAADESLATEWPRALYVFNKCDLPAAAGMADPLGLTISAIGGAGLETLLAAIAARLVPHSPPVGQAMPFLPSHVQALTAVRRAVACADWTAAQTALAPLLSR
jgi:tRNA modification GTPase